MCVLLLAVEAKKQQIYACILGGFHEFVCLSVIDRHLIDFESESGDSSVFFLILNAPHFFKDL